MKPAHKSKDAGQIVNRDKTIQTLSDYIVQVQASEKQMDMVKQKAKTFDQWINEPWLRVSEGDPWISRAEWWTDNEIDAARQAWRAANEALQSKT